MAIAEELRNKKRSLVNFDKQLFLQTIEDIFDKLSYGDYIHIRGRRVVKSNVGFITDIKDEHFSGGISCITIANEYFRIAVSMLLSEKFAVYRSGTWDMDVSLESLGHLDSRPQIKQF